MFIIGIEVTSEEKLLDTDLVGFFESEDAAEQWLLNEEYEKEEREVLGEVVVVFIRKDVFTSYAFIKKLEKMT